MRIQIRVGNPVFDIMDGPRMGELQCFFRLPPHRTMFSELLSVQSEVFFELLSTKVYFHLSDQIMIGSLLKPFLYYTVNPPTVFSFVFTFLEL